MGARILLLAREGGGRGIVLEGRRRNVQERRRVDLPSMERGGREFVWVYFYFAFGPYGCRLYIYRGFDATVVGEGGYCEGL